MSTASRAAGNLIREPDTTPVDRPPTDRVTLIKLDSDV